MLGWFVPRLLSSFMYQCRCIGQVQQFGKTVGRATLMQRAKCHPQTRWRPLKTFMFCLRCSHKWFWNSWYKDLRWNRRLDDVSSNFVQLPRIRCQRLSSSILSTLKARPTKIVPKVSQRQRLWEFYGSQNIVLSATTRLWCFKMYRESKVSQCNAEQRVSGRLFKVYHPASP